MRIYRREWTNAPEPMQAPGTIGTPRTNARRISRIGQSSLVESSLPTDIELRVCSAAPGEVRIAEVADVLHHDRGSFVIRLFV